MLRTVSELDDFDVKTTDGRIGQVVDFYFDDQFWAVRFLVVRTDDWLDGRKVLISPWGIGGVDAAARTLRASLTRERVRLSPEIDTHKPVSRQHEIENYGYYGFPFYWGGSGMWGKSTLPSLMSAANVGDESAGLTRKQQQFVHANAEFHRQRGDDPHLRSCRAISGYHLHASDGELGHVEGFVLDDESWAIRYLIVNTSDWWLGHLVLIAPASAGPGNSPSTMKVSMNHVDACSLTWVSSNYRQTEATQGFDHRDRLAPGRTLRCPTNGRWSFGGRAVQRGSRRQRPQVEVFEGRSLSYSFFTTA